MRWKLKRGEISLLSGIGNYGKSSLWKYIMLMRVILYGEKFALFTPEDNPAEEFYHDLVLRFCWAAIAPPPTRTNHTSLFTYSNAYDWVANHIFYVYPKDLAPTPEYVKERFLELYHKREN
jgi:hypothetical protein